jgi:hypothetical protein
VALASGDPHPGIARDQSPECDSRENPADGVKIGAAAGGMEQNPYPQRPAQPDSNETEAVRVVPLGVSQEIPVVGFEKGLVTEEGHA